MDNKQLKQIEVDIKQKYGPKGIYPAKSTSYIPKDKPSSWSDKLLYIKLGLVKTYLKPRFRVLDLACGNGIHSLWLSDRVKQIVGIDLSPHLIKYANNQLAKTNVKNVQFLSANIKKLPLKPESFDLVFSFSALYYVPEVDKAIMEITKVLKLGGIAILDMGNLYSLNAITGLYHSELARQFPISVSDMRSIFFRSSFRVIEHKSFQIFPMWSDRPWWLFLFLHPIWKKLMAIDMGEKMIDEIISSLPGINYFAFRHIWVLKKI
jgi:SAM-dependent methyltransferase